MIQVVSGEPGYTHVQVFVDVSASGEPVLEVLPARRVSEDYEIHGSPALAYGFAAGDRIRLADDGTFEVVARGGNLCLRLYPATPPSDSRITELTATFAELDGIVESPADRRFVVITVPVTAGFPAVEGAIGRWATEEGCVWEFGNVYDDNGEVLDWIGTGAPR